MSMMDAAPAGLPLAAPAPDVIPAPGAIPPAQIKRDPPEVDPSRGALVTELCKWSKETRQFRAKTFDRMRRDISFVRPGKQWKGRATADVYDAPYEANLVQRHVQQRVAALYAKNPTVVAKRKKRLDFAVWDGDRATLEEAIARVQGDPGDPMTGRPPVPPMPTPDDIALIQDVADGMNHRAMLDRVAKTVELLYTYFMSEGVPNFKMQAKQLIRRVETTGVGFVQLGFQRVMKPNPEVGTRIRDDQPKIARLETLASDMQADKLQPTQAEIEVLKLGLTGLQEQQQIVAREGLVFDFPASTDILVDRECTQLKGFIGARRVAREYHYTKDQIKDIFKVDVGTNYTQYEPTKTWQPADTQRVTNVACVWAIWDQSVGLVYYVCDGYADFLREPMEPEIFMEGFFPWKVLSFNDIEDSNDIYPPSDVEIVRPMQLEYNRSREGLREHRIANKPGYVAAKGMFDEESKKALQDHDPNELVELNLSPDAMKEGVEKYLAVRPTAPIDPAVYDAEYLFTDFQRVSGDQAANLGGTSGATATEASIAETSRVSSLQSNIDDVDDFLSSLARAGGQVLLAEMSPEMVKKIVGPGAVWPTLSREEIAEEIDLEIIAGSSGRPNKALEIANMERMAPYLIQMKGLKPDWLLRQMMMRMDENADLEDAFDLKIPSVVAQNAIDTANAKASAAPPGAPPGKGGPPKQVQPGTGDASTSPDQQGPEGSNTDAIGVPKSMPGPNPDFPTL